MFLTYLTDGSQYDGLWKQYAHHNGRAGERGVPDLVLRLDRRRAAIGREGHLEAISAEISELFPTQ